MGVEPRTATEMIEYIRLASARTVDACQVYSLDQGHGHRPRPDEIEGYFADVLSAIRCPCVISTHQSVGYVVPVALLAQLVERFDHVIGINVSHQDHGYLARIIDAVGDRVDVHVGGPAQALLNLSLGGTGYLTSEANLAPALCSSLATAFDRGDIATVFDAFGRVVRLSDVLYRNGGIRATKAVLNRLGLPGGVPRRPQLPVTDRVIGDVLAEIDRHDLLRGEDLQSEAP
jgi:4-hydroxy-tetrahydrodipicolinate synthase